MQYFCMGMMGRDGGVSDIFAGASKDRKVGVHEVVEHLELMVTRYRLWVQREEYQRRNSRVAKLFKGTFVNI